MLLERDLVVEQRRVGQKMLGPMAFPLCWTEDLAQWDPQRPHAMWTS